MDESNWLLQTKEGRIFGPLPTSRVLELISQGAITGDERLSEHPSGTWHDISHYPVFYDRILETLARTQIALSREARDHILAFTPMEVEAVEEDTKPGAPPRQTEIEDIVELEPVIEHTPPKPMQPSPKPKEKKRPRPQLVTEKPGTKGFPQEPVAPAPTLELKSRPKKKKQSINPKHIAIAGLALLILILYFSGGGGSNASGYIHLLSPNPGENRLSEKDLKTAIRKIVDEFQRDTFQGYSRSQDQLVGVIEDAPRNAEAIALLCLTHRELWPYSYQDDQDLGAISKTSQLIASVDPIGYNGATCRAVQQLVNNHPQEAMSIIETVLQEFPSVAVMYEIKGELLAQQKDFVSAISYVQKTQQLWPGWLKPYISEGQYRSKIGQFSEAATIFRGILKNNPKHGKARVLLGIIEFNYFQHPDQAIELLKAGLSNEAQIDRETSAQGFATLGFIYEKKGDRSESLKYAQKAFALRPIDENVRALILRMGGEKALQAVKSSDNELVAVGDQYLLSGNILAAQAQYKTAFEVNKKNSVAALKAARALWKLNDSHEAIEWATKAVQANPNFVEAYVTLAEYYTHRYDFAAAGSILQKAQRISPSSYEVFRGWAVLELKRNNYPAAVGYAKKALASYDTDLESHLLLVRAFRGQGNHREAYQWAARAIELDSGNPKAQSLYAEVLADFQGVDAGVQYIRRFVNTYTQFTEYKVTLARILKKEERFEEAVQVLTAATSEQPNNKEALLLMASCLQSMEKLENSRAYFLAAAALDPSDPGPLFELGLLYLNFKKPDQAMEQFQRVQRLNNRYPKTNFFLGKASLMKNDALGALKAAENEKKLNPRLADAYILAGEARMEMKDFSRAANEFQAALKLRPSGAEIYVKLAISYRLTGNPDTCLQMLKMAEINESGYPAIYKERGACFELKNDASEAIEAYNRYLQILPNAPDKSAIDGRIQNLGGG
ncbi:MAG: tetratricopeptide repeat protein [Bdellovibrionia bacterium]